MKTNEITFIDPTVSTRKKEKHIQFLTPSEKEIIPRLTDKMEFNYLAEREVGEYSEIKNNTFNDYVNNPKLIDEQELSDTDITKELIQLKKLLASKNLFIDSLTNIDDRTMYRFIAEEFLKIEMDGSLYGKTRYIYEEFHTNEIYQIKKACSDFLRSLFAKDFLEFKFSNWKKLVVNYPSFKFFRNKYSQFGDVNVEMLTIRFLEDVALLEFNVSFSALHDDQIMISRFEGEGKCYLSKIRNNWDLHMVLIPGIV